MQQKDDRRIHRTRLAVKDIDIPNGLESIADTQTFTPFKKFVPKTHASLRDRCRCSRLIGPVDKLKVAPAIGHREHGVHFRGIGEAAR
jgi:hypothetical protein